MELGLSLGSDASRFLENKTQKSQQKSGIKNGCPDFCMGLSLNSCAVENLERVESQKSQENDEDEDEDEDEDDDGDDDEISKGGGSHYNFGETPLQLNLLPLAPLPRRISNLPWSSGSSENGSSGNMGVAAAKRLDVSRTPAGAAEEVSSANSVGEYRSSTGNGNLSKRELANDVVEGERGSDDDENGAPNRKKLRLSKEQSAFLEESFKEHSTLNPKQKLALAKQLNLRPRQVEVWFQNRRARTKLKQTEVDCEYLKKWCETVREENRRLQKEVQDLRALKASNPFYMQLPATTLTMCPSCERVATAPAPEMRRSNEIVDSTTTSAPIPLNRSRFYPFSQTPNQPS